MGNYGRSGQPRQTWGFLNIGGYPGNVKRLEKGGLEKMVLLDCLSLFFFYVFRAEMGNKGRTTRLL